MHRYQRCPTRISEWLPERSSRHESWDARHTAKKRVEEKHWLVASREANVCVVDVGLEESAVAPEVEAKFNELAQRWRNEVKTLSSTTDRVLHSAYQDIIGMGRPILPLILRELERNGGHWFWALRHITHENPVPQQDAGNIKRM